MENTTQHSRASAVAWIALLTSIVALGVAIVAFNRSGTDLDEIIEDSVQEGYVETRQELAEAEARMRLIALRTELAAEAGYAEAAEELAQIRANLDYAYENAEDEVQQEWQELDAALERAENNARLESAESVQDVQNALELLERDIESDEN